MNPVCKKYDKYHVTILRKKITTYISFYEFLNIK